MCTDGHWNTITNPNYQQFPQGSSSSVSSSSISNMFFPKKDASDKSSIDSNAANFVPLAPCINKKEWQAAKEKKWTDVVINVQGELFHAHKIKLMMNNQFFDNMFSVSMKESLSNTVELKDIDPKVFKVLLKFIYMGTMGKKTQQRYVKDINSLLDLLVKADYLQVDDIVPWSSGIIKAYLDNNKNISTELLKKIVCCAFQCRSKDLMDIIVNFISNNCGEYHRNQYDRWLAQAVGLASDEGLITKELWEIFLKSSKELKNSYGKREVEKVLSNCRDYNPLIAKLYDE